MSRKKRRKAVFLQKAGRMRSCTAACVFFTFSGEVRCDRLSGPVPLYDRRNERDHRSGHHCRSMGNTSRHSPHLSAGQKGQRADVTYVSGLISLGHAVNALGDFLGFRFVAVEQQVAEHLEKRKGQKRRQIQPGQRGQLPVEVQVGGRRQQQPADQQIGQKAGGQAEGEGTAVDYLPAPAEYPPVPLRRCRTSGSRRTGP